MRLIRFKTAAEIAAIAVVSAAISLVAAPASAVDLARPVYKAPPPVAPASAPVQNWTGFYLGGGGGYGSYRHDSDLRFASVPPLAVSRGNTGSGWFGTAVAGVDYQMSDRWVAGLFADYDWADLDGQFNLPFFASQSTLKMSSAWAIGGRLGYLVMPTVLLYATGGYSAATFEPVTVSLPDTPAHFTIAKRTFDGWFAGAGIETQLLMNWSTRIEYRYADYGAENATLDGNEPLLPYTLTQEPKVQTIRASMVYKFNGPNR